MRSSRADLGILDKAFEAVHKIGPVEGVAANAHHCALPQTLLCCLVDGLQQKAACLGTFCTVCSAPRMGCLVTQIACSHQQPDSEEACFSDRLPAAGGGLLKPSAVFSVLSAQHCDWMGDSRLQPQQSALNISRSCCKHLWCSQDPSRLSVQCHRLRPRAAHLGTL